MYDDQETLLALVEEADVLFDNFSPGTLEGARFRLIFH